MSRGAMAGADLFGAVLLLNGLGVVGEYTDVAGNAQGGLDDFPADRSVFFSSALAAAWA
jgi:hypothetical protein